MSGSAQPIVIGVLHPSSWYGDDAAFAQQLDALRILDPRIEVIAEPFYGSRTRRAESVADADAEPQLSASQRDAFARMEVALTLDLPTPLGEIAPNLRWVQSVGAGVDHLQPIVAGLPIALTTNGGSNAVGIAEFVMARLLGHYKPLDRIAASQVAHEWTPHFGRQLAGDTLALLGFGPINQAVAARAAAFGMRVVVMRRNPGETPPGVELVVGNDRLHDVLAMADAVVAAMPDTPATTGMIGAAELAAMKRGAFFCNVGRGSLVDEGALADALRTEHLGSAAIDVASAEPLPADHPLWDAPRLAISAHCSSVPAAMFPEVHRLFRENVRRYLAGEPLASRVDDGPA